MAKAKAKAKTTERMIVKGQPPTMPKKMHWATRARLAREAAAAMAVTMPIVQATTQPAADLVSLANDIVSLKLKLMRPDDVDLLFHSLAVFLNNNANYHINGRSLYEAIRLELNV